MMIVDLLRNDLGRVAEVGSVRVPALCRRAVPDRLAADLGRHRPAAAGHGLVDLFRALFPCGSVTGAPKAARWQLIGELEPTPRGVYCGAVGLVAPPARRSGPGSTSPSAPRWSTGPPARRSTGPAAASPGAPTRPPSTPSCSPRRPSSTRATEPELLETMLATGRGRRGLRNLDRHLAGWPTRPTGSASGSTATPRAGRRWTRGWPAPARPRVRLRLRRDGGVRVEVRAAARARRRPGPAGGGPRAGRPAALLAAAQDDPPRALRAPPRRGTRRPTTSSWSTSAAR